MGTEIKACLQYLIETCGECGGDMRIIASIEDNSANSRHSTEQLIEMQLELPRNRYWGDWVRLILREAEGLASE